MGRRKGPEVFRIVSANTENENLIKAGGGKIRRIIVNNDQAAIVYLKLFDKAAVPVNGTDTPMMTVMVAADADKDMNFGDTGVVFDKGLGMSLVTGIADTDTTAPTAANQIVQVIYE